jgi:hypothetical protein
MRKNWVYVTLLAGGAAMVGIAFGGSAAIVLGTIAISVSAVQLYVDYLNGDQTSFVGDAAATALTAIGLGLGFRALRTAWALKSLRGPLEEFIKSGNLVGVIAVLARGGALIKIKRGIDTRSIYYAVSSGAFGVFTAANASSDACV